MSYPLGNNYWTRALNKAGRKRRFATPQELIKEADDYFNWVLENPLTEYKAFGYTGKVVVQPMPVIRAMTISQFCLFAGISSAAWNLFKRTLNDATEKSEPAKHEFLTVIDCIENVIFNQKFQAAAGNLLNANIISRELGLVDRVEQTDDLQISWKEDKTYLGQAPNAPAEQRKALPPSMVAKTKTAVIKKIIKNTRRKN